MSILCHSVRFRPGFEALDPRTGHLQARFEASETLEIVLEGDQIHLRGAGKVTIAHLSGAHGVTLPPADVQVAVPAAKPAKKKEKVA